MDDAAHQGVGQGSHGRDAEVRGTRSIVTTRSVDTSTYR